MTSTTGTSFQPRRAAAIIARGLMISGVIYMVAGGTIQGMLIESTLESGNTQHDHGDHDRPHDSGTVAEDPALRGRFDVLRRQSSNSCGLQPQRLDAVNEERLQGSCCGQMVFHSYQEQITGLKQYADYEIIPPDPYNVSVAWAGEMVQYAEETELAEEQQAVYDKAKELSHEGGPCCCRCWHWYAYGGLGEKLIVEYDFSAEQIAEVWGLSDACGGNHAHA